jgi:hypothetical protein
MDTDPIRRFEMHAPTIEPISGDDAVLAQRIQEAAGVIRRDVESHDRIVLLSDIRQLRRWLSSLEYEVIDGPQSGRSDAC